MAVAATGFSLLAIWQIRRRRDIMTERSRHGPKKIKELKVR
jgi:hypothetical protein